MLAQFIHCNGMRWKRENRNKRVKQWNLNINCFLLDKFFIACDALSLKIILNSNVYSNDSKIHQHTNAESFIRQRKTLILCLCSVGRILIDIRCVNSIASRTYYMQNQTKIYHTDERMSLVSVQRKKYIQNKIQRMQSSAETHDHPAKHDKVLHFLDADEMSMEFRCHCYCCKLLDSLCYDTIWLRVHGDGAFKNAVIFNWFEVDSWLPDDIIHG